MIGISFFGVTPGFVQRDFAFGEQDLASTIYACRELSTLDQFSVRLPPAGTLHVFGGQVVDGRRVSFLGRFRRAIEYRGTRDGGHYGVGLWLVDRWAEDPAVTTLLDRMMRFLQRRLVDADGRVQRTFDEIDWTEADAFLDQLHGASTGLADGTERRNLEGRPRKLLLAEDEACGPNEREPSLRHIVRYLGSNWDDLENRIVYASFDAPVIQAIRSLSRVSLTTFDDLVADDARRLSAAPVLSLDHRATPAGRPTADDEARASSLPAVAALSLRDDFGRGTAAYDSPDPSRMRPGPDRSARPADGARGAPRFKWRASELFRGYFRPMLWYCFIVTNTTLFVAVILLAVIYLDRSGDAPAPSSTLRGRSEGEADPGAAAGSNAGERPAPARGGPPTRVDPNGPNSSASDALKGEDDRGAGTEPIKVGADVLCPRRTGSAKELSFDQLRSDAQTLSGRLRGVEARLAKLAQAKDPNVAVAKADVELFVKLIQREKAYQKCVEQLP